MSGQTDRLWLATKTSDPETKIYILAISHLGLPLEYDAYLSDIVLPAFQTAEVFHAEGLGGRENEPYPRCDSSTLDSNGLAILHSAREKDISLAIKVDELLHERQILAGQDDQTSQEQRAIVEQAFINGLDEFELIQNYTTNLSQLKPSNSADDERDSNSNMALKENIVTFLLELRPTLRSIDLDTKYGVRKAYCNLGKERIKFLESHFNQKSVNSAEIKEKAKLLNDDFLFYLNNKRLPNDSLWLNLSVLDNEILCSRSNFWIEEIKNLKDKKVHFIAVGARHIFDNKNGNVKCKGLISKLFDNGYNVSLLREKN
jgi:hypothetical protein